MITDDDLLNMPENPELAFVQLERTMRENFTEAVERSEGHNADALRIEYINRVLALKKALSLDIRYQTRPRCYPTPGGGDGRSSCVRVGAPGGGGAATSTSSNSCARVHVEDAAGDGRPLGV
jgi:hypothetical protein